MKRKTSTALSFAILFGILVPTALAQPPKIPSGGISKPPSQMVPPAGITGPTENITKVAQAITTRAKSLSTLVIIAPGVQVTQPVTINILYFSPANYQRITQACLPSTGNRFLYNDGEGDGKPRQMNMHITLEEPRTGGGVHTFTWSSSLVLDPLYDVKISSLDFTLLTDCDLIGKSEITFSWESPGKKSHSTEFGTRAGARTTIDGFAWGREEVSASDNFVMPDVDFEEHDPFRSSLVGFFPHGTARSPSPRDTAFLVPGTTHQVVASLEEAKNQGCTASVQYTISYNLR